MKSTLCLLLIAFAGLVASQESVAQYNNDNMVLNYALTLENFEAALYDAGRVYTEPQYEAAGFPVGSKVAIDSIGDIERAHANQLTAVLNSRGYPAVAPCSSYNFGFTSVTTYVQLLATIEAAGTGAYDGAAVAFTNKGLLAVAAGIATVEARHTAIIQTILNATNGAFAPVVSASATTPTTTFAQTINFVQGYFNFATCPSTTLVTQYAGTITVNSNNTASYHWVNANTLRAAGSAGISANLTITNNDLSVLNYALALENLESNFYSTYATLYNVSNIMAVGFNLTAATIINGNIQAIGAHEALHVTVLTNFINMAKASSSSLSNVVAGTTCTYAVGLNLATSTFLDFLKVSVKLENTGVSAYVGAIGFIGNSDLTTTAASIATVEGNHAAYVANLLTQIPTAPAVVNVVVPNPTNSGGTYGTTANVAAFTVDAGATPTAVEGIVLGGGLITCSSNALLGTPAPIALSAPIDFFNDQAQINTLGTSSSSNGVSSSTNGVNTNTGSSGSATAVFVSVFVLFVAALF